MQPTYQVIRTNLLSYVSETSPYFRTIEEFNEDYGDINKASKVNGGKGHYLYTLMLPIA